MENLYLTIRHGVQFPITYSILEAKRDGKYKGILPK